MSRFDSFKNLINAGGYKLADIMERINGIADRGEVTLEERDRLLALAKEHADPLAEADRSSMLAEHERRIRMLEEKIRALCGADEEAQEYIAGTWYYAGDQVIFEGETYRCAAPQGIACVWSPVDYPLYWSKLG